MATAARATISSSNAGPVHVCPFCGSIEGPVGAACPRCTLEDTPATRQATKQRIGPWFVLQKRNPAAPGMNLATLRSLIAKRLVKPASVVRGPTTAQLWRLAAHTKGVSREFGLCYSCRASIDKTTELCPECERSQVPPSDTAVMEAPKAPAHHPHVEHEHPSEPVAESVHTDRSEIAFTDGDLLTPKDLAKAFHLDYDPNGVVGVTIPKRRVGIPKWAMVSPVLVLFGVSAYWMFHSRPAVTKRKQIAQPSAAVENVAGPVELASAKATSQPSDAEIVQPVETKPVAPGAAQNLKPQDDPHTLWFMALDAEAKNDFATAMRNYEKIEALPKSDWPAGLQTRLKLVRQELAAGTH